MELRYLPHVEIRLVHDKTYQRGGTYKKWTDAPYSSIVHKTVLISFLLSFILFQGIQSVFPYLNLFEPRDVKSASNPITWETESHFTNNGATNSNYSGSTTSSGLSFSNDEIKLNSSYFLDSSFGTGGAIEINPSTGSDSPGGKNPIISDGEYIYIAGRDYVEGNYQWRIEKRDTSGALVTAFGTNGIVLSNPSSGTDSLENIYIVGNDLLLIGYDNTPGNDQWRIEKRNKIDGSLVTDFGSNGVVTSNPSSLDRDRAYDVVSDGQYLYICGSYGYQAFSVIGHWRIEKRDLNTGSLITGFGSNGAINVYREGGHLNEAYPQAITYIDNNIYIGGGRRDWYIEKRSSSTGALDNGFGVNGVIEESIGSGYYETVTDIHALNDGLLVTGYKYSYEFRSEKRNLVDGSFITDFGGTGYVNSNPSDGSDMGYMSYISGDYFYNVGQCDHSDRKWCVEKRNLSDGTYDNNFGSNGIYITNISTSDEQVSGITEINNYLFLVGYDDSPGNRQWRLERFSPQYGTTGSLSAIKVNQPSEVSWQNVSWNGTEPSGTDVKFRTRSASSEIDLGSATWSSYVSPGPSSSASLTSSPSKWLEVEVVLESDGSATPIVEDFTVTYNFLESPVNSSTTLYRSGGATLLKNSSGDSITPGVAGGWTSESTIKVTNPSLTCTDCGGTLTGRKMEVQYAEVNTTFPDETTNVFEGTSSDNGDGTYSSTAEITDLSAGNYHMRMRAVDDAGRVSAWQSYGNNTDVTVTDFSVEQTPPTVSTFKVNSDDEYSSSTSVTLNISANDTGGSGLSEMQFSNNGTDWGATTNADGSIASSSWATYSTTHSWDLLAGADGNRNVYARFRDNAGNVSGDWLQSSDADFNAGSLDNLEVSNNSIFISEQDPLWTDTVVTGVQFYNQNQGTSTWKSSNTACDTPQCAEDGGQNGDYLISNNAVDFSNYPARNVCKAVGGRLPSYSEFEAIYNSGTFSAVLSAASYRYWINEEASVSGAYYVDVEYGAYKNSENKSADFGYQVPCVRDVSGSGISGTYESISNDSTIAQNYGTISWSADVPVETGSDALRFQVASNNDDSTWNFVGPDGTAESYYDADDNGSQLHSSHNGNRYIKYKAYLQTADSNYTPTVNDILIEITTIDSDSIILDVESPDSFDLSTPTNDTWSTNNDPSLTWNASSDENNFKYQLYIDDTLDTNDIDSGTTTITPTTVLTEGNHTWYVKAVDLAGNETQSTSTWNIGYDTSAPSLVLDPGFTFAASDSNSDNVTLTWNTYEDDSGNGSPVATYTIERLRYSIYESNSHTLTSNWASEDAIDYELIGSQTSPFVNNVGETETDIEQAVKYIYRIKVIDEATNESTWLLSNTGLTSDGINPTEPTDVAVSACDGSAPTPCSDTDPNDGSSNTVGYSTKIAWTASTDTGSGVTGYKIYRKAITDSTDEEDFNVVGYLDVDPPGAPVSTIWYDNDTHNGETYSDTLNDVITNIKTSISDNLNDHVEYFYRVTAVDASGNETDTITTGVPPVITYTNWDNVTTIDVTSPAVPTNLTVTPVGIDSLGGDPLTQRMDVSWGASTDLNNQSREPNCIASNFGCSIKEYTLQQAQGDIDGPTEGYTTIYTGTSTTHTEEGLNEDTYYYYKIMSIDKADNTSAYSTPKNAQTKNSQVPTSPTNVSVTAKKGDPNSDSEVGTNITVSFNGSRITGTNNRVDGYRVYRSTSNLATEAEWLALTPVQTYENLNIPTDTQDGQRSFDDIVPNDATSYYYKVIADGWNDSSSEVVTSSLSAVSPDTLNQGWDTTPDATAPTSPLEITVKDIHGDGSSMVRNIITWQRLDTTLSDNLRNGSIDFAEYRVYRYTPTTIDSPEIIVTYTDLANNYYVDGIPIAEANDDYFYYVVAVDNADTEYKYASPNQTTVINSIANISEHLDAVSINPAIAKPSISNIASVDIGVSSATVEWTTDQSCDSVVEYRKEGTTDVLTSGKNRQTPKTDHSVKLKSLDKNSVYEYRIISENSLGNSNETQSTTWPESQDFTTADFSITKIEVDTTTTTATIEWKTSVNADSSVEYKQENSSENSRSSGDPVLTKQHTVVIEALRPATTYTYKIRSVTDDNYVADTTFSTFSTKAFDADQFTINPSASDIAEENITATSAKIVWNTAIATDTWVDYGTESEVYNQAAGNDDFNTVHVVELKNLTPGVTYYYRVRGTDVNDIEYTSKEYSFTAVLKPTVTVAKVENVTSYTADIVFNTNVDTEASVMYGTSEAFGLQAGTAEQKRNHTIHLKDLEDATTYYYYIEIRDKISNSHKTSVATFATPIDKEGAKVDNLKIDLLPMGESDETASVIISWNTNKPTTTKVEYDEGVVSSKLSQSTIEDESLNNSHTVIIKELIPSTTYKFRIAGKDKRGNETSSSDYTFVTPAKEKSIWQLILRSIEDTFSWVNNVGNLFRR